MILEINRKQIVYALVACDDGSFFRLIGDGVDLFSVG